MVSALLPYARWCCVGRMRLAGSSEGHSENSDPSVSRCITARNLARSFPADDNVVIPAGSWFDGSLSPLERYVVAHLARFFQPKTIVEIGTFRGTTTRLLLENTPAETRIFTIDLPPDISFSHIPHASDERLIRSREIGQDFAGRPRASNVVQVIGNSADEATSRTSPATWISHSSTRATLDEAVKADMERLEPHLGEAAVLVWHDYSEGETEERGVGKLIREKMADRDNVFLVTDTALALQIPRKAMLQGRDRIKQFFPEGDFDTQLPGGIYPWLRG